MTRQRGFTIIEVLVALFVASLLSVFVLSLTRSQLVTYEMQGQVNSTQENIREAFDYVETSLRKVCSGVAAGKVRVQLSDATKFDTACIKVYDGAIFGTGATVPAVGSVGSFQTSAPATKADAIELIYGDGSGISMVTAISGNTLTVSDWSPFSDGDYILVSDMLEGFIFQILSHSASQADTTKPPTATVVLKNVAGDPSDATIFSITSRIAANQPVWIMPAKSVALYVDISTDTRNPMLMLDPDGVIGNDHTDAQPLAEGVEDLQIAIGFDGLGSNVIDGYILDSSNASDEWVGNAGTTEYTTGNGLNYLNPFYTNGGYTGWSPTIATNASPRQVRLTMIVRSLNKYAGAAAAVAQAENRNQVFSGASGTSAVASRYRNLRVVVSPRAWNTTE